jgi:hypothetical protein
MGVSTGLFGVAAFVRPDLSTYPTIARLVIAATSLILIPAIALLLIHFARWAQVLIHKAHHYDSVVLAHSEETAGLKLAYSEEMAGLKLAHSKEFETLKSDLSGVSAKLEEANAAISNLVQVINHAIKFEVKNVLLYKECLYVELEKNQDGELAHGDKIVIVDTTDGRVMGQFEITEIKAREYRAKSMGSVDSLWLGFVRLKGDGSYPVPPDTIALQIPMEEKINHDG